MRATVSISDMTTGLFRKITKGTPMIGHIRSAEGVAGSIGQGRAISEQRNSRDRNPVIRVFNKMQSYVMLKYTGPFHP